MGDYPKAIEDFTESKRLSPHDISLQRGNILGIRECQAELGNKDQDELTRRIKHAGGLFVFLHKWGELGDGDGEFAWPGGIAVDGKGKVYVVDVENNRIQAFKRVPAGN